MAGRLPYLWVARLLAAILFLAAGLKIYGLRLEPVVAGGIFSAVEIQVAIVEFEIVLALWLWSGARPILSWLVALVTFSSFAAASAYLAWIGQSSCGCFGAVRVNPFIALALDGAILLGLVLGRPDLTPLWSNPRAVFLNGAFRLLAVIGSMTAIFGLVLGLIYLTFGSLPEAMAYLRGDRVQLEPRVVDMGDRQLGEVHQFVIQVINRTDQPVRVIGASHDCSCRVDDLPLSVPTKESRTLSFSYRLAGTPGIFSRRAALLVEDDGFKQISFRLTGRILPNDEKSIAEAR